MSRHSHSSLLGFHFHGIPRPRKIRGRKEPVPKIVGPKPQPTGKPKTPRAGAVPCYILASLERPEEPGPGAKGEIPDPKISGPGPPVACRTLHSLFAPSSSKFNFKCIHSTGSGPDRVYYGPTFNNFSRFPSRGKTQIRLHQPNSKHKNHLPKLFHHS